MHWVPKMAAMKNAERARSDARVSTELLVSQARLEYIPYIILMK